MYLSVNVTDQSHESQPQKYAEKQQPRRIPTDYTFVPPTGNPLG